MKKSSYRIISYIIALILAVSLSDSRSVCAADEPIRVSLLQKYDSADLCVVGGVDTVSKTIWFRNHDLGKDYTLNYDNTTWIYDIYGRPLSSSLIREGEAVYITFLKNNHHLNYLKVTDEMWCLDNVTDFDLLADDEVARIGGEPYRLDHRTLILSDGRPVYPEDILDTDTLRVVGVGKDIYGITVTRGHGYVSLSSDTVEDKSLIGAWIELDNEVIRRITPHMLISAPEGSYQLGIRGTGSSYNTEVVIKRGAETVIDTSVVETTKPKEGTVCFTITPPEAVITVDGKVIPAGVPTSFTYGTHELKAEATGYITQNSYLKVAEPSADVSLSLTKTPDADKVADEKQDEEKEDEKKQDEKKEDDSKTDSSEKASTGNSSSSENSGNESSDDEKILVPGKNTAELDAPAPTANTANLVEGNPRSSSSNSGSSILVEGNPSDNSSTGSTAALVQGNSSGSGRNASAGTVSPDSYNYINGYYVTFDLPKDVEAYLDGNYLGVLPLSFSKVSGTHTVTLKKKGYKNRSFTIEIDSERTNLIYTFPDLVKKNSSNNSSDDSDDDDERRLIRGDNDGTTQLVDEINDQMSDLYYDEELDDDDDDYFLDGGNGEDYYYDEDDEDEDEESEEDDSDERILVPGN